MQEIELYIESYFGIRSNDLSPIAALFEEKSFKKNDYFLRMNQYSASLGFVKEGFLRIYGSNQKGDKEITQWISTQGMFVTELSSFMFQTPARWNIQALTDCTIYTINQERYNQMGQFAQNWSELEKLFIAKCFITLENRVFNQLSMSAEEKYLELFESTPHIFNQVPLQYIASMLGMTPETLSRIRRKMVS